MRKCAILGILVLSVAAVPARTFAAITYDAQLGLYSSYEYTDNYRGTVSDERSEGTYLVGPSLYLTGVSPTVNLGLTGRYTRSFHNRFSEDDSPEIHITSSASYTTQRLMTQVSYGFVRSLTRETLSEPFGERRYHTGGIGSTWQMTQWTSVSVGYDIAREDWMGDATDEEDVTTHNGSVGVTHRLSPFTTLTLAGRHSLHDYEDTDSVKETSGSLRIEQAIAQNLSLGLFTSYNHEDRGDLPGEDRYDARLTGRYTFLNDTVFSLEGGSSWLVTEYRYRVLRPVETSPRRMEYRWVVVEDEDSETEFTGSASLEKSLEHDRFSLRIAKEYTSEFTTNRYGSYDTTSGSLDWEKTFWRGWTATARGSWVRRKPTRGTEEEETTDTTGAFTIGWNPIEHLALRWEPISFLVLSLSYEHLTTEYETSGTARENRYGVMAEVRY